jgi:hypothetical protein
MEPRQRIRLPNKGNDCDFLPVHKNANPMEGRAFPLSPMLDTILDGKGEGRVGAPIHGEKTLRHYDVFGGFLFVSGGKGEAVTSVIRRLHSELRSIYHHLSPEDPLV